MSLDHKKPLNPRLRPPREKYDILQEEITMLKIGIGAIKARLHKLETLIADE